LFKLEPGEQMIKKTKPHSASFLSSPLFWVGVIIFVLGSVDGSLGGLVRILLVAIGVGLIGLAYLRRINAYTLYFTDRRIVSSYSFLRKAYREMYYEKMFEAKVIQGIFGRVAGYADLWLYGYQQGLVVGRMRGVRIGDCQIVLAKAWKDKIKYIS
jgi:PH (Pleckstrin Homology) domain-containing protein